MGPASPASGAHQGLRRRIAAALAAGPLLASMVAGQRRALAATDAAVPGARPLAVDISLDIPFTGYLLTGASASALATARLLASRTESTYRISLSVESFLADITYESEGDVGARGLVPRRFSEVRKVAFRAPRSREARYLYPFDAGYSKPAQPGILHLPAGSQDRLSLMVHLMAVSRADTGILRDGNDLSIPFASTSRVTQSRWRVSGPEPVPGSQEDAGNAKLPEGFKVVRVADSDSTVDVSFWLATDPAHLPLVLQFSESGRSLRFVRES